MWNLLLKLIYHMFQSKAYISFVHLIFKSLHIGVQFSKQKQDEKCIELETLSGDTYMGHVLQQLN